MYRVLQSRLFLKLSSSSASTSSAQLKLLRDNARLYCNHIKPETTNSSDNSSARYEVKTISDKRVIDNHEKSGDKDMRWVDKVVYSSYLEKFLPPPSYTKVLGDRFEMKEAARHELVTKSSIAPPISVKYMLEEEIKAEDEEGGKSRNLNQEEVNVKPNEEHPNGPSSYSEDSLQFPYKIASKTQFTEEREMTEQKVEKDKVQGPPKLVSVADKLKKEELDIQSLLQGPPSSDQDKDKDVFEEAAEICIEDSGTADPNCPPSNVPCGGCGAYLHCQDQSLPGYVI